jgi:flavin reductase (DIM6/NTAB) family NADH-FMN oxidoreductase RutF
MAYPASGRISPAAAHSMEIAVTVTVRQPLEPASPASLLKEAMRYLVGGVSVITAGVGEARTGLTVTSAVSLSMDPPTMLICVNRNASAWPVIQRERHYCVNVLGAHQQHIAERFTGRGGAKGAARYDGADWFRAGSRASGLEGALAVIDCEVEEIIERHSHGIIVGSLLSFELAPRLSGLVYWNGQYIDIGPDSDLDLLAEVGIPLAHAR